MIEPLSCQQIFSSIRRADQGKQRAKEERTKIRNYVMGQEEENSAQEKARRSVQSSLGLLSSTLTRSRPLVFPRSLA